MTTHTFPLGHKLESSPSQVLKKALTLDVVLSVAGEKLHAAGNRNSVAELAPLLRQHRDELVRLLTAPTSSDLSKSDFSLRHMTLAPDPGAFRLLAMAMVFCDRTSASAKARAQWQQDTADTPPELRRDLYQYLLEQLPPVPALVTPARPAPNLSPPGWLAMDQAWRATDAAYQTHHWQCPTCRAAAAGHAEQCVVGQRLHSEYTQAATTAMNGTNT